MQIASAIGIGTAGVAAVSVATWIAMSPRPQLTGGGPSSNPPASSDDAIACVGQDSVLRVPPASGLCPKGSTQITLAKADLDTLDPPDDDDALGPTKKPKEDSSAALSEIERRIAALESAPLFEVVDRKGRVLFSVAPERVQAYNGTKAAAAILATADGGEFVSRSADGRVSAYIGAYADRAGLRLKEGNAPRLDLLKRETGNYSFTIPLGSGLVAGIGESPGGTGAIVVGDLHGRPRASMAIADGKGALTVVNEAGNAVASFTESINGGGLLVVTDASSSAMVKMGSNSNRYGVVMTFPPGLPYVPKSGLPGSYLLGCAGGGSCVP